MRCVNCGNEFQDGLLQCPFCGTKVDNTQQNNMYAGNYQGQAQEPNYAQSNPNNAQSNYGAPQGQPYGQPNYGYSNNGFNPPPVIANAPEFVMYLIIGIVYSVCCCNFLIGIPGIIFTVLMNTSYKSGDTNGYLSNRKISKWIYIIGIILWVIGMILSFVFGIAGSFLDAIRYY